MISVLRDHGFEGASLSRFTERSGLIKASLYHRFPQGKEQIANAALEEVGRIFATHVLAPIDEKGPADVRLKAVAERLHAFYEGGTRGCLLETLSSEAAPETVRQLVKELLEFWVSKFAKLAKQAGIPQREAKEGAEEAVAAIEGALVVSRAAGSGHAFQRSLRALPKYLLGAKKERPSLRIQRNFRAANRPRKSE